MVTLKRIISWGLVKETHGCEGKGSGDRTQMERWDSTFVSVWPVLYIKPCPVPSRMPTIKWLIAEYNLAIPSLTILTKKDPRSSTI